MAGGSYNPHKPFTAPHVHGKWLPRLGFAAVWFFILYRVKQDGPHHFLGHHPWEEPKNLAYLEEVDKKYGTRLSKDNIHGHH